MKRNARAVVSGIAALFLGLGLLTGPADTSRAADDEVPKELKDAILKIADLLEAGKTEAAKKEAVALAKKENLDGFKVGSLQMLMRPFRLRSNKGFGIGDKPGVIKPDGIESKFGSMHMAKKALSPKALADEGPALKKAAYISWAIAEVTAASPPSKENDKKTKADWKKWSTEMTESSQELAKALGDPKPDPKAVYNAARKLDGTCTSCHQPFRPAS